MGDEQQHEALTAATQQVVLPWRRSLEMCWLSLKNRRGRILLVFLGIAVVTAFLVDMLAYHRILADLRRTDDVHTRAVLERAGVLSNNPEASTRNRDQMAWLLGLSALLCLVGVTNTMFMSVNERFREIGTLKCLGALDSFIVRLFMIESLFIGMVGSSIGAVLGFLLALLQLGMALEFGVLQGGALLRALVLAVPSAVAAGTFLTVVAAIYPARVGARMKPVDAMRVEV